MGTKLIHKWNFGTIAIIALWSFGLLQLGGCSDQDKHIEDQYLIGTWKHRLVVEKDGVPVDGGEFYYIYNKPSQDGIGVRDCVSLENGNYSVWPSFPYRIVKSYDNGRSIVFQRLLDSNSNEVVATVEFNILDENGYDAMFLETNGGGEFTRSWRKVIDEVELQAVREAVKSSE